MYSARYSCQILTKLRGFLAGFSKNTQISNFMKIRSVGAELSFAGGRADGQTDRRDEASSPFS
jgi:hypothetical protein